MVGVKLYLPNPAFAFVLVCTDNHKRQNEKKFHSSKHPVIVIELVVLVVLVVLSRIVVRVAALILGKTIILVLKIAIVIGILLVGIVLIVGRITAKHAPTLILLRHRLLFVAEQIPERHLDTAPVLLVIGSIAVIVILRHTVIVVPAGLLVSVVAARACDCANENRKSDYS